VAGEQNTLTACSFPCLLESERTELGNLPVNHGRKFIDYDPLRFLADDSREVGPEPFAIGQRLVRT
jgi:hypothetical protein